MQAREQVYIGFGANLGNRTVTFANVLRWITGDPAVDSVSTSSLFITEPEGVLDQPMFLNCVIGFRTVYSPFQLLSWLKLMEKRAGRISRKRWREREADLDILIYGDLILDTSELTIPHRSMHERLFVLEPLAELVPERIHPVLQRKIENLRIDVTGSKHVSKVEKVIDRSALLINNGPLSRSGSVLQR